MREAIALMAVQPDALSPLVHALPEDVLDRGATADEWSPRRVLAHLVAVESGLQLRIRGMAQSTEPEPVRFAPIAMPATPPPARESLSRWRELRAATIQLLEAIDAEQLRREGVSDRFGTITVAEHIVEWAYHDLDHLRQVEESVQAWLYPHIGRYRGLYPPPFLRASGG